MASMLEDAAEQYCQKMAERGADLVRQQLTRGRPMVGSWEPLSPATKEITGASKPYQTRTGSLMASVFARKRGDLAWEFGISHPAVLAFEFGWAYERTVKQSIYLYYLYGVTWAPHVSVFLPPRPIIKPATQWLEREQPQWYEHYIGNLVRLAM